MSSLLSRTVNILTKLKMGWFGHGYFQCTSDFSYLGFNSLSRSQRQFLTDWERNLWWKKEISLRVIRALPRMKSFEASPTERASFKAAEKLQSKLSFKGKKKCWTLSNQSVCPEFYIWWKWIFFFSYLKKFLFKLFCFFGLRP